MRGIFERASVRSFSDRPVEEEKIERLLRAAMAAPSAGNEQPWEFYVVTGREALERLSRCSPYAGCVKGAPAAVVLCFDAARLRFPECALLDMSAAAENLLLAAQAQGLGAVWLGVAPYEERMEAVRRAIDLPKEYFAFAIVPVGYPLRAPKAADRFDAGRIHRIG